MKRQPTSYPRDRVKILLLENLAESAVEEFESHGYTSIKRLSNALAEDELIKAIKGVHILGIRSKTQITDAVLAAADKLLAVGCFCIGTNQVDLEAATKKGVAVFNAPYSNTRSVAELVIGLFVMLIRRIPDKNLAAHQGTWLKDAAGSFELRGKKLGIIGYGNIGSQVSVLAEAMGMDVHYYDIETKLPHGNATQSKSLKDLLKQSDIVTLHVPSDETTRYMINPETLKGMKRGAILVNYSRGDVVDLDALKKRLDKGNLSGAAIDVYPEEPKKKGDDFDCGLKGLSNVILTPHIGGSTQEAQTSIGVDAASKLIKYLEFGTTTGSHSIPQVSLPPQAGTHRILHIHENIPGVLSDINTELSEEGINIVGQYLSTNPEVGYVILDIDSDLSKKAFEILKKIPGTIKIRMVY
ncbi:MAG: phosphoglycerate dehydrogenase [Acidobacteria bacterium]|nr:MAG: phosphoglycerate dehydrogenase [Acidobacteriota bacterium]REJ98992.1 MAG: phosphoglycerate dehydrogenase [Acidobacteriota bacterium]REK16288.1 MAG: phosphoglycerate dehydrogenase [Acidobacteriota bacterium]REK43969.1 MAG: phosphoglycerate dehydrogenase [Acidobacteriota bacterium]